MLKENEEEIAMPATQTTTASPAAKPRKLRAPLPPPTPVPPAIPPGFALVPKRLTKAMKLAAHDAESTTPGTGNYTAIWKAMLAAAPAAAQAEPASSSASVGRKRKN